MTDHTFNRRHFLRSTAKVGMALTLANTLWLPSSTVHAQSSTFIPIPAGVGDLVTAWRAKTCGCR